MGIRKNQNNYLLNLVTFSIMLFIVIFGYACSNNTVKLTYNYNYDGSINIIKDVAEKEAIKLITPLRDDYTFVGWYYDQDCINKTENEIEIKKNITLYAKWEEVKNKYTITYNCNGGIINDKQTLSIEYYGDTVDLLIPTKEGYYFGGWYLENDLDMTNEITYVYRGDYSLKAKWIKPLAATEIDFPLNTTSKMTYKDITYKICGSVTLKMDIYLPIREENKTYPVLFFFYGGGWFMGKKEDISYISSVVNALVNEGFIVVSPNYRLVNGTILYPLPVQDIMDSIRYIVKYKDILQIDMDNLGATGYSAGGYFALMAGFAQDYYYGDESLKDYSFKMKYIVDMFGPAIYDVDMLNSLSGISKAMLQGFFGTNDLVNEELASAFPDFYLDNNKPNVMIIHGEEDTIVPVEQSKNLETILIEKGIHVESIYVKGAEHTLGVAKGFSSVDPSFSEICAQALDFILDQREEE